MDEEDNDVDDYIPHSLRRNYAPTRSGLNKALDT